MSKGAMTGSLKIRRRHATLRSRSGEAYPWASTPTLQRQDFSKSAPASIKKTKRDERAMQEQQNGIGSLAAIDEGVFKDASLSVVNRLPA
jgi:hypothetical protein